MRLIILSLIFGYCSKINVRKEWRELQPVEKQAFIKSIQLLKVTNSTRNPKVSVYDEFTYIHYTHTRNFHKNPQFLPYHRVFLIKFEESLNTVYQNYLRIAPKQSPYKNITIVLPYWNYLRDGSNIPGSVIWKDFGGFGTPNSKYCVPDGPFKDFKVTYSAQGKRCLRRKYENGKISYYLKRGDYTMPKMINFVKTWGKKSQKYNEFRYYLEWSIHTMPHIIIGGAQANAVGDMGQLDFSPNDPIFFVIHPTIDKVWSEYQKAAIGNLYRYDGKRFDGVAWNSGQGREVNILDRVQPFSEYRVIDVMDTKNLCYVYSQPWLPSLKTVQKPPYPVNFNIISPASSILVKPYYTTLKVQNPIFSKGTIAVVQNQVGQKASQQNMNQIQPNLQPQPQQQQQQQPQSQLQQPPQQQPQLQQQQQQQQQQQIVQVQNSAQNLSTSTPNPNPNGITIPPAPVLTKRNYMCDSILKFTEGSADFINWSHQPYTGPASQIPHHGVLEPQHLGYMKPTPDRFIESMERLNYYLRNCIK
eukprot:NODE_130_length_16779_cov_1.687410.p1 type:complete len:529 gc:universal NODE_130_length_16779_cov_1.687410:13940-12354(-)